MTWIVHVPYQRRFVHPLIRHAWIHHAIDVDVPGAASAARRGADATAAMELAEAGRSNYLSREVLMGTPDPGAVAVAVVLEAMAQIIQ